jgi:hypothetical protein
MITTAILEIPFTDQNTVSQCYRLTKCPNQEDAGFLSQIYIKKFRLRKLKPKYPWRDPGTEYRPLVHTTYHTENTTARRKGTTQQDEPKVRK